MAASLEMMISKDESEFFNTAFYRYLELRADRIDDDLLAIRSDPCGAEHRKRAVLWSDDALIDFTRYWVDAQQRFRRTAI